MWCSRWAPGGEEGEVTIGDATTDQETARPQTIICTVEWLGLEVGQFEITPIVQPRSFGSGSRRQALPVGRAPRPGEACGRTGDRRAVGPGSKHIGAADPPPRAFAFPTSVRFHCANTVTRT